MIPTTQHAPTTSKEIFTIKLSALLMELETNSVIAPDSTGISPRLMLSTMFNARLTATVTITDNAISVNRIKIDPRRYCFKTMCPIPGNTRPEGIRQINALSHDERQYRWCPSVLVIRTDRAGAVVTSPATRATIKIEYRYVFSTQATKPRIFDQSHSLHQA